MPIAFADVPNPAPAHDLINGVGRGVSGFVRTEQRNKLAANRKSGASHSDLVLPAIVECEPVVEAGVACECEAV